MRLFLFHACGQFFPLGWAGINTFLVITAYFLTKKYLQKPQTDVHVRDSLKKRAIRLYPSYLTVIIVMTALFFVSKRQLPGDFFSYFLFAQNFQKEFVPETTQVPGTGHFWYLTLDFYLVMIWLIVLRFIPRRYLKLTFILLLIFSVGYRSVCTIITNSITMSYILPWGMMDAFAAGGLLALISLEEGKPKLPWLTFIMGMIFFSVCIFATSERFDVNAISALIHYRTASGYADSPLTVQIHLALTLLSFFVVWLCVSGRKHFNILSNRKLVKLGGASYELFVFHFPILWLLNIVTNDKLVIVGIGLFLTIVVTMIWKRFLESKVVVAFT